MSFFQPVNPGDGLHIPAAQWNAVLRTSRDAEADRLAAGGGPVAAGGWHAAALVHVRNDTGSTWPAGGVYRLGAAVVDPEAQTAAARRRPTFEGLVPTGPGDAFAVALEIARAGSFALCAVTGAAVALLEVVDAAHGYAAPAAQVQLRSGLFGPVRILHKGAGTGVMTALVLLNPSGPVDEVRVHVRGKTRVAAAGAVPAHWEYDCREVKKVSTGGTPGGVTWNEFAGAATYAGVLEDQDRELAVDGTGGFVSQAYVLHADPSGKLWVSCDQYAGRTATPADPQDSPPDPDGILPGLVSTQKQEFAGPKTLRDTFRVRTPGGLFVVEGKDAGTVGAGGASAAFLNLASSGDGGGFGVFVSDSYAPGIIEASANAILNSVTGYVSFGTGTSLSAYGESSFLFGLGGGIALGYNAGGGGDTNIAIVRDGPAAGTTFTPKMFGGWFYTIWRGTGAGTLLAQGQTGTTTNPDGSINYYVNGLWIGTATGGGDPPGLIGPLPPPAPPPPPGPGGDIDPP